MHNLNITILPFIFLLLIVGVLLMIISRGKNWWRKKSFVKEKPFFFNLYSGILLVVMLVYILFPSSITTETLKEYDGEFEGVHQLGRVHLGEVSIDKITNFKETDQTYSLEGTSLHFKDTGDEYFYNTVNVLIVKEPSLQNEYHVETYQTPLLLNGKDMTPYIDTIAIREDHEGVIIDLPREEASFKMYDYSFPFKQFNREACTGNMRFASTGYERQNLIIVYIPTDIELDVSRLLDSGIYHIEVQSDDS